DGALERLGPRDCRRLHVVFAAGVACHDEGPEIDGYGGQGDQGRRQQHDAHRWAFLRGASGGELHVVSFWPAMGRRRNRLPAAAKIALATAGASGGTAGSPAPPGGSSLATTCTSTSGISFSRTTG